MELEYPKAFQDALLKVLDVKKTFNYVYLGGAFTEPNQEKNLWLFSKGRHVRVRFYPCLYNASQSPSYDRLTLLRDLHRHNSWSLKSRIRM